MTGIGALSAEPLVAVFDLARHPGQDVFAFLLLAEMAREKCGRDSIHVVLVADDDGADGISLVCDFSATLMLLPSVRGFSLCGSRSEAAAIISRSGRDVFPGEFEPTAPRSEVAGAGGRLFADLESHLMAGRRLPVFETPRQALEHVNAWTEPVAGRRHLVTITPMLGDPMLRDGGQGQVWTRFVDSLDPTAYCPVVVTDVWRLAEPLPGSLAELPVFPGAGLFSPLRFALYKRARVNLIEGIESLGLCRAATDIRCIGFGVPAGEISAFSGPVRRFFPEPVSWPTLGDVFREVDSAIAAGAGTGQPVAQSRVEVMGVDAFFQKALTLQTTGGAGRAQAVTICSAILKSQPMHHGALGLLGINAMCLGRLDHAAQLLRRAAEIAGSEPAHYYNLGNALTGQVLLDEAAAAYRSAVSLDPEFYEAWESLGAIYQARGQFAEAVGCYGRILKSGHRTIRLLFDHAHCLAALGRHEEAAESYLAAGQRYLARQDKHECVNEMSGGYDRRIYAPRNARFLFD